jgi:hypothetical protein
MAAIRFVSREEKL